MIKKKFIACELHYCTTHARNPFLGAKKLRKKATISFIMTVGPQGTTRLPLDGFS